MPAAACEECGAEWVRDYDSVLARSDIDVIGLWTPGGMYAGMATRLSKRASMSV